MITLHLVLFDVAAFLEFKHWSLGGKVQVPLEFRIQFEVQALEREDQVLKYPGLVLILKWKMNRVKRVVCFIRLHFANTEIAETRTAGIFTWDTTCCIVIQWTVTHGLFNHNDNIPFPVWKSCSTGFRNLSKDKVEPSRYRFTES